MKDQLQAYSALRSNLIAKKREVEARIRAITDALGGEMTPSPVEPTATQRRGRPSLRGNDSGVKGSRRNSGRGRSSGGGSLKDAAIAALKGGKTLSRQDLLIAVVDGGYKFAAKNPLNSLNTVVYSQKKFFKVKSGQVSLS